MLINFKNILTISIMVPVLVETLDMLKVNMTLDYFEFKNIKHICTISCSEDNQDKIKLTIQAGKKGMFLSWVKISAVTMKQTDRRKLLSICWKQHLHPIGILLESSCKHFEDIMIFASEELMLPSTHQWFIIQNLWDKPKSDDNTVNNSSDLSKDNIEQTDINDMEIKNDETINVFKQLNLTVESDIVLSSEINTISYKLFDVFNFGRIQGGKLNIVNFGTWNKENGLEVVLLENKYRRRQDFQGLGLRMVYVKSNTSEPFDLKRLTSRRFDPEFNLKVKLSASVLIEMAEEYNIKFVYTAVDRWYGSFAPNGSKGVSTSLAYREQDVSPMIRPNAELVGAGRLELAQPPLVWYISSKFYYRIPNSGVGKFENNFLTPLSGSAWICVVFSLLLCVVILVMAAKLEQRPGFAQYAVFSVWANVCQQFFEDAGENATQRNSTARKVTMLITGMSCVLIFNYYTSSVVSNLLNGPPPSINSLEELANSPLELILEDIGVSRSWLYTPGYTLNSRLADAENYLKKKKVLTKKPGDPLFVNVDEGVAMVKAGGYAFAALEEAASPRFAMVLDQTEMCEIGSIWAISPTVVLPALPYRGGYKEFFVWAGPTNNIGPEFINGGGRYPLIFTLAQKQLMRADVVFVTNHLLVGVSVRLTRLRERGIITCINERMKFAEIKCMGTIPRALALGGAAPAFVMLALGIVASIAVMILEILEHRYSINAKREIYEIDT